MTKPHRNEQYRFTLCFTRKAACFATLFLALLTASCGKSGSENVSPQTPPPPVVTPPVEAKSYLELAKETRTFVSSNFLTSGFSYRANLTNDVNACYEWYNVSQIYADLALFSAGDQSVLPYLTRTTTFMDSFWDKSNPDGGYFASVNLNGTNAGGDKYVDDNALSAMVYLEAYETAGLQGKDAYLGKAEACANWLMKSGLWDNVYGGGFWWSTAKQDKPTQTNGLAMQLFSKLYKITGEKSYLDWAVNVNNWLRSKMLDAASGLYIWKIDGAGSGVKHFEKFTYDNAIMIEANILYGQAANDPSYLSKAQAIGDAMNTVLFNAQYKLYIFNTDPAQNRINPAWCGWGTQGMIRLYEQDKNQKWLTYARNNIDGLNKAARNPDSHAYYFFSGYSGNNRSPEIEGVDQAWMQRIQAMMSKYDQ